MSSANKLTVLRSRAATVVRRYGWASFAAAAGLLVWSVFVWASHTRSVREVVFDDAFITLRYARNLAEHGVLSFNLDDRVDGYTSPGWTLILAVALALGANGEIAMRTLSWVFGLLAGLLAALLARRLGASPPGSIGIGAVGTFSTPGFVIWSVPGMEMSYAAAVSTALLVVYTFPRSRRRSWLGALLMLACATARPECVVLVTVLLIAEIRAAAAGWRDERFGFSKSLRYAQALVPQLVLVGCLALLFVAHWVYYGYPFPNTYYAKPPTRALVELGLRDAVDFLGHGFVLLAVLLAAMRIVTRRLRAQVWVHLAFLAWATLTIVVYARVGGDFVGFHRYYQPLIPPSFALVAGVLAPRGGRSPALGFQLRQVLIAVVPALLLPSLARPVLVRVLEDDLGQINTMTRYAHEWRDVARALRLRFSSDTSIAVRPAGIISWVTDFKVIDVLALNNPEIAHNSAPTRDVPGHQLEATHAQVVHWRPDVVVWHPLVVDKDLTGFPPDGPRVDKNRPYLEGGYIFECTPLSSDKAHVCYWVLPEKARASSIHLRRRAPASQR